MAKNNSGKNNFSFMTSVSVTNKQTQNSSVPKQSKIYVYDPKMVTGTVPTEVSDADWERAALEVLDEHAGAWKRLADK